MGPYGPGPTKNRGHWPKLWGREKYMKGFFSVLYTLCSDQNKSKSANCDINFFNWSNFNVIYTFGMSGIKGTG